MNSVERRGDSETRGRGESTGVPASPRPGVPASRDPGCPFCESPDTELVSLFGSQLLVSQYRCRACHTYFEAVRADSLSSSEEEE
jgi:hypothetical protein